MSLSAEQSPDPELDPIIAASIMPQEKVGLGRGAVYLGLQAINGEEYYEEGLKISIENTRHKLADAGRDYPEDTAEALERDLPLPSSLKLMLGMDEQSEPSGNDLLQLLTSHNPDFSDTVPDATFANFLDWHNHKLVESQANLTEAADKYREEYATAFRQGIEDGWIPQSSSAQLDLLPRTVLVLDDGFSTSLQGLNGYFTVSRDGTQYLAIKPHDAETDFNGGYSRDTIFHELTHALTGRESDAGYNNKPAFGLYRVFGPVGGEITNEALTEHQSEAMLHGQIDIIDPTDHLRSSRQSYLENRQILHTLCNEGVEPVDIRLFSAEYFRNSMPESEKEMHIIGLRIEAMKNAFKSGEDVDFDNLEIELPPEDDADVKLKEALARAFPFTNVIDELANIYSTAVADQTKDDTFKAFAANLRQRAIDYRTQQTNN